MKKPVAMLAAPALAASACAIGFAEEPAQEPAPAPEAADAAEAPVAEKTELKELKAKISYSIGHNLGKNFKRQGIELDPAIFALGLKDALSGGEPLLTSKEMREVMTAFYKELRAKQPPQADNRAEKNKKEGAAFLIENAKREGVKTLPSGLQYEVIHAGDGPSPKDTDQVSVHYRGTLIDGAQFDSSIGRKPATFRVNSLIPGFTEALKNMRVGDKWLVFIPGDLAYGERGGPGGPFATLIFDIELLGIK